MNKPFVLAAAVLGVVFVVLACVYWFVAAGSLPAPAEPAPATDDVRRLFIHQGREPGDGAVAPALPTGQFRVVAEKDQLDPVQPE